ncbi:MAG: LicD family protein [Bacteroidaceae bacterium]|nr:LicD family protein [Bacteroidaceae bacterium]
MNLNEEIICGYTVPAKMKRVWAIELEMVKKFVEVCSIYGLRYYITSGTLLGAVRHKGFIPWDNDVDILMPRKDYNKLQEIGPDAFKAPFFFQTPVTEKGRYYCGYTKIRHELSTATSSKEKELGLNGGVFIDIFCLDELPDNRLRRRLFTFHLNEISKMQRFCFGTKLKGGVINRLKHGLQRFVYRFVYQSPDAAELFLIFNRKAGKFSGKGRRELGTLEFGYHEKFVGDRIWWNDTVLLDFEDLKLCAPKCYDEVLRKQYGDYMQIPDDKSTHDYYEFDPDVPYKDFYGQPNNN